MLTPAKNNSEKLTCDLCVLGFTFVVGGYETQDVFVAEHGCLVDLSLAEPGSLLSGRKDLHRHVSAPPASAPHLSKATFPDDFLEDDGSGHGPLDKQRQTCSAETRERSSGFEKLKGEEPESTVAHRNLSPKWTDRI